MTRHVECTTDIRGNLADTDSVWQCQWDRYLAKTGQGEQTRHEKEATQ